MFNTIKPLSIISARTANLINECRKMIDAGSYLFQMIWGEMYENYHYRAEFSFKLPIIKVFKTTR
jgi:hypothetical protein